MRWSLEIEIYIPRKYTEDCYKKILEIVAKNHELPRIKFKGDLSKEVIYALKIFSKYISLDEITIKDFEVGRFSGYLSEYIHKISIKLKKPIEYLDENKKIKVYDLSLNVIYYYNFIEAEIERQIKIYKARNENVDEISIRKKVITNFVEFLKRKRFECNNFTVIKLDRLFFVEEDGKLVLTDFSNFINSLTSMLHNLKNCPQGWGLMDRIAFLKTSVRDSLECSN